MRLKFETSSDKQKQACMAWADNNITDIVYGGAKGGGKSYLGVSLIFHDALTYPGTRYFIARKKLNDLRKHTIPSIEEVFRNWGIDINKYTKFNGQDNVYECYNGSTVLLIDAKLIPSDPMFERFGSMQITRGWIEEAGEFENDAKKNLAISVGRWLNDKYGLKRKLLMTCNPKKNFLYTDFYIPWKNGTLENYRAFIPAFAHENTKMQDGYLEQLETNLTDRDKDRLLHGNWEYADDEDSLIRYDKILELFTNDHVQEGKKYITADIARLGGDRIVKVEWSGFIGNVDWWKKQTLTFSADKIEQRRVALGIAKSDVLIDADGLGVGLQDFSGYKGFVNGAKPMADPRNPVGTDGKPVAENFDMLKSQCYYHLADRINNNGIYLKCKDKDTQRLIVQELEQVKQKVLDTDLKKGVIPKDKVKQLLNRSPDFSDALMMREFYELKPKFVQTATGI